MKKSPECLDLIYYGAVAKPDADIAGLGVIIAFTFSAASKCDTSGNMALDGTN
jgi:hypothetical protein